MINGDNVLFDEISEESEGLEFGNIFESCSEDDNVVSLSTHKLYNALKESPPEIKLV